MLLNYSLCFQGCPLRLCFRQSDVLKLHLWGKLQQYVNFLQQCLNFTANFCCQTMLSSLFSLNSTRAALSIVFIKCLFWSQGPHKQMRTDLHNNNNKLHSPPYSFVYAGLVSPLLLFSLTFCHFSLTSPPPPTFLQIPHESPLNPKP